MSFDTKVLLVVCGLITFISGGAALYAKFYMRDSSEKSANDVLQDL